MVMGPDIHMTQVQPRVSYVFILLWSNNVYIWLYMSIMSCNKWYLHYENFRDYAYGDVVILEL